jgi:nicotinamide-nucleotide amidase
MRVGVKIMRNSLEKAIGDLLRKNGRTLSIAESCTGGLICDRITDISGSSDYFMGGMVTYSNESKAKHLGIPLDYIKRYGAVSPQVAKKMAQGVRKAFNTTFGLSTTGVAGPTGGTKRSPVGRVFIGLTAGRKVWVKKLDLKGTRKKIKEKATEKALRFFYEKLIHGDSLRGKAGHKG